MSATELGEAVHDDVGSPLKRPNEIRGRHRVVDDQRNTTVVGNTGDALDIENVVPGVGQHLAIEGLGVVTNLGAPLIEIVGVIYEGDLDAHLGQRVVEQIVGTAVQRR